MADELVEQKLRRDLDEATKQHMPVMVVQTSYISDMICRTDFDAAEIAALKSELATAREWTTGGTRWNNEQEYDRVYKLLTEARGKALEEAAKACEAHMSQCLDDRDIQKRWPQIKARNAVYAQAIRDLARR